MADADRHTAAPTTTDGYAAAATTTDGYAGAATTTDRHAAAAAATDSRRAALCLGVASFWTRRDASDRTRAGMARVEQRGHRSGSGECERFACSAPVCRVRHTGRRCGAIRGHVPDTRWSRMGEHVTDHDSSHDIGPSDQCCDCVLCYARRARRICAAWRIAFAVAPV